MPKKSADAALFQSPLAGKSVCFAGRMLFCYEWDRFLEFLRGEGIHLLEEVSESLDYLVLGNTGFAPQRKKAEQLNRKKSATIAILDESQFYASLVPTLGDVLELIGAGEKGVEQISVFFQGDNRFTAKMPSLNGQDLRKADLRNWGKIHGVTVEDADLRGANLSGTYLRLHRCRLDGAKVENAHFSEIENCSATSIDFSKAHSIDGRGNLKNNDFRGSKFCGVRMGRTDFAGCRFDDADLSGADMPRCVFTGLSLRSTDLTAATLFESKLDNADLRGCKFAKANLSHADLTGANVEGGDFTEATLAGAILTKVDVGTASGLDPARTKSVATIGPAVKEWVHVGRKSHKLLTRARLSSDKQEIDVELVFHGVHYHAHDNRGNHWFPSPSTPLTPEQMLAQIANRWAGTAPVASSITMSATKASLPNKELKTLATRMWCELFGIALPSEEELKQQKNMARASKNSQIEEWVQTLRNDKNGVEKWNNDTPATIKHLKGKLHGVDLSTTNLAGWRCEHMDCKDSNFAEADLRNCQLQGTRLVGCDLTRANLQEVYLLYGSLKNAKCHQANLVQADLRHADLCGADFTGATLKDAKLDGAKFDEHTKFPKGFKPTLDMKWQGAGPSPALIQQVAKLKAKKPLDSDAFMKRLEAGVDSAKLDKALAMLKADRFKLYAQVSDDHLVGIVKSQGDPNLVYSCKLAADGTYGCCTQNLNICGGLRGSLCKHLLVLIVGLTKAGDLDPNKIDTWVLSSKGQKPVLDKDAMSETFLRYKGAEAGEVDWRPTETIPEDFYAM